MDNDNIDLVEKVKIWLIKTNSSKVISDSALRITVGFLGILLPVSLVLYTMIFGDCEPHVLPSISDYFHSKGRSIFIAVLSGVSLTFFVFRGYNRIDSLFAKIACFSCLGIIAFPTSVCRASCCHVSTEVNALMNTLHFTSAGIFFSCLVVFCIFLFPLSYKDLSSNEMSNRKKMRKGIYLGCGYIMIVCVLGIIAYSSLGDCNNNSFADMNPVFWFETIMLGAFSVSWLTKSEYWWPDEELDWDKIA